MCKATRTKAGIGLRRRGDRPVRVSRYVLGLLAALLALALGTTPASAFVSQLWLDDISAFSGGSFDRTGLVNIPSEGISAVQLMPIGLSGQWVQDRTSLPVPLQEFAAVSYGSYIYTLGGRYNGLATDRVYIIGVNSDGSVASIQAGSRLPDALLGASAFVYSTGSQPYIYLVGGWRDGSNWTHASLLYRCPILSNGSLGAWELLPGSLPYGVYYAAVGISGSDLYVAGGISRYDNEPSGILITTNAVFHTRLDASGYPGDWYDAVPLGMTQLADLYPSGVAAAQMVVYHGDSLSTLYLIGGRSNTSGAAGEGQAYLNVVYADINADGSLSGWALSDGNLPVPLHGHGALVVGNDEILISGGRTSLQNPDPGVQESVKAALMDPTNSRFRLFDWCQGDTGCQIGAWQTGAQLPETRSYHGMVQVGDWIYVLGGSNASNQATSTIYRGTVSGAAQAYAPSGTYESPVVKLGDVSLVRLSWNAYIPQVNGQPVGSLRLRYKWRTASGAFQSDWIDAGLSADGDNTFVLPVRADHVAEFKYRLELTASAPFHLSPRLEWIKVIYDAPGPELAVALRASKTAVRPGDLVTFTMDYNNNGGVAANGVTLTQTLPAELTCISTEWQALSGNRFQLSLGSVPAGSGGSVRLTAQVGPIGDGVEQVTDRAEVAFPPMTDLDGNLVGDSSPANNVAQLQLATTPLSITGTATADPPGGSQVSPGQDITYQLSYRVGGGSGTSGVVISALPATGLLTNLRPLDGGVLEGSTVRWYPQGTLPSGYSGTVRFVATVARPLANGTSISTSFSAMSTDLPSASLASVTHTVVSSPALRLDAVADPAGGLTLRPGQQVTYTLTARNVGGENASGASVSATLSQGLVFVGADPVAQASGQQVSWNLGTLAVDSPVSLKLTAVVADNVVHGQEVQLGASLASTGVPGASTVVTHSISIPASLTVSKQVQSTAGPVHVGEPVTFALLVRNTGGEACGPISLSDTVPPYTHGPNGEGAGTALRWDLPGLAGGASAGITYSVRVDDQVSESVHEIGGTAARAVSGSLSATSGSPYVALQHAANLYVSLDDGTATARPGQSLTYVLSYGNRGGEATGAYLSLRLGQGLIGQGGAGWQSAGDGSFRYDLGTLAEGSAGQVPFLASVASDVPTNDATFGLRATAAIASQASDTDPYDNSATDIDIVAGPDLAVTNLSVSPAAPRRGQALSLSVTIANVGLAGLQPYATVPDLKAITVEVYVRNAVSAPPSGPTDHVGGSCADTTCSSPRLQFLRSVPVADLEPGKSVTLTFPAVTTVTQAGVYDVYAQVDSGGDPTWGQVREGNEVDNLASLRRLLVADIAASGGSPFTFLPLVQRQAVAH